MKNRLALVMLAGAAIVFAMPAAAQDAFQFAFVSSAFGGPLSDDNALRTTIAQTDEDNLAFVVVNGIKSSSESCGDHIYERRKALLENAKNGVIFSLTAADWSACRYHNGRTAAVERLSRLRELFFPDDFSLGSSKLPIVRQSANIKFRDYSENVRWEIGNVMFATVNLPRDNNHYLNAGGRNGEFEDRLIADRDWLQRIVTLAKRGKSPGIVLFCDADPIAPPPNQTARRDGFVEIRRLLENLAAKFPGKILVVHTDTATAGAAQPAIRWHRNLGDLGVANGWIKMTVSPSQAELFTVGEKTESEAE
jgi:hypothetical protein